MPAGTAIIGRVAVKVIPDTSKFKEEAQAKLDAIERRLEIKIPAVLDVTGLKRDIIQKLRELNAENKATDSRKVRLYTKLETTGIKSEIVRVRREYQAAADATQKVDFATQLGALKTTLELDKESLKKVEEDIKHWRNKNDPVKLNVKLDWGSISADVVKARLALLTRPRTVDIIPKIDNKGLAAVATALAALSGARVLSEGFDNLWESLSRLDKLTPRIGGIALGIVGLAGSALASSSNILAFGQSLAQIGPAALALPGIIGGVAIGVGTMVAAFRDFNTIFPDVQGKLSAIQDTISTNFWASAKAPMREMIDTLLPEFATGLAGTATQLGSFFGNLSGSLRTTFAGVLTTMFADLHQSIAIAAGGTDAYAGIIKTLGAVGAGYLPKLAQWFVDISNRFNNFLSAAAADGRLQGWIDEGITELSNLARILGNIGGIFAGLARAAEAAGGSTFGILADTLSRIHKVIDTPAFQNGLTDVFMSAHKAFTLLGQQSGPAVEKFFLTLGSVLANILPQVGSTIGSLLGGITSALSQPAVVQGITSLFSGIEAGVTGLLPALAPVGAALGEVFRLVGTFATGLGPLISTAIGAVAPVFMTLARAVEQVIPPLMDGLGGAIAAIAPGLQALGQVVGQALVGAFTALAPILPVIGQAIGVIATALAGTLAAVLPSLVSLIGSLAQGFAGILVAVMPLVPPLFQLVTSILVPLAATIAELVATHLPGIISAFSSLVGAIMPVVVALQGLWNLVAPLLIPVLQLLASILLDTVVMAINGVTNVITGAVDVITGIIMAFKDLFTGNWKGLWEDVQQILKGAWELIKGFIEIAMTVGIMGILRDGMLAFKVLFKTGWTEILTVIELVWTGIKSAFGRFLEDLLAAPGAYMTLLKRVFSEAWTEIKAGAGLAWDAVKTVFSQGVSDAVGFVTGLPSRCASAIGDTGRILFGAGKAVIEGFINGIKSMIGDISGVLGGITSKLPSWKGPEDTDRTILFNAGQLVIGGFIRGLESRYDDVRDSLKGLTDDVSGVQVNAPSVKAGALAGLSGVVSAALDVADTQNAKVFNYYAAPGSSLGSQEDLFSAMDRGRAVGW